VTEPAPEAQPVLTPLTSAAIFLILTIDEGGARGVSDVLTDVPGLARSVSFRDLSAGLSCVVGIGSTAWDQLFDGPRPAHLHPFKELRGSKHHAVATDGDLLVHIRATRMDFCFELARHIVGRLRGSATVCDEVHGFKYFDERDLLGFVDGTENPIGAGAAAAVTVGDEDPSFAGSSYVITQKYLHDLEAWAALPVEGQEKVIGRSKLDDIEMADDVKPTNSHVALNTIVDADGNEQQIVRDNMPFGQLGEGEFGTYFIGYASDPGVIEQMLSNMFLGDPPGNYDRILDFSTAHTGNLFFVPTADFLDDPPPLPGGDAAAEAGAGIPPRAGKRRLARNWQPALTGEPGSHELGHLLLAGAGLASQTRNDSRLISVRAVLAQFRLCLDGFNAHFDADDRTQLLLYERLRSITDRPPRIALLLVQIRQLRDGIAHPRRVVVNA
jgi:porphyrinogen peroxidase